MFAQIACKDCTAVFELSRGGSWLLTVHMRQTMAKCAVALWRIQLMGPTVLSVTMQTTGTLNNCIEFVCTLHWRFFTVLLRTVDMKLNSNWIILFEICFWFFFNDAKHIPVIPKWEPPASHLTLMSPYVIQRETNLNFKLLRVTDDP